MTEQTLGLFSERCRPFKPCGQNAAGWERIDGKDDLHANLAAHCCAFAARSRSPLTDIDMTSLTLGVRSQFPLTGELPRAPGSAR